MTRVAIFSALFFSLHGLALEARCLAAPAPEVQRGLMVQVPRPQARFGPEGVAIPEGTWRMGPTLGVRLTQRYTFQQADVFASCTLVAGRRERVDCTDFGLRVGAGPRLELERLTLGGGLSLGVERVLWPDWFAPLYLRFPGVTWELMASPSVAVDWRLSAIRPYAASTRSVGVRVAVDGTVASLRVSPYDDSASGDAYRALRVELFVRTHNPR